MYDFNCVFLDTAPKRELLEKMEKLLSEKMAELKEKKDALAVIEARISELNKSLKENLDKKE